jgi:hypothetical protein
MHTRPHLQECEVHWAIKQINATITNGILTESNTGTILFEHEPDQHWDTNDQNVYLLSPSMTLADPHAPGGLSTYQTSNITARKVWQALSLVIPSNFVQPVEPFVIAGRSLMKVSWLAGVPHLVDVPTSTLPWDVPSNVTAHLAGIVDTMNQVIRNNALSMRGDGDVVIGQAWRSTIVVSVNWPWFSFPATLWCIAVTFLTATIWRSSKNENSPGAYKTSLLPMLLNRNKGLGDEKIMNRSMGSIRKQAKGSTCELKILPNGGTP